MSQFQPGCVIGIIKEFPLYIFDDVQDFQSSSNFNHLRERPANKDEQRLVMEDKPARQKEKKVLLRNEMFAYSALCKMEVLHMKSGNVNG